MAAYANIFMVFLGSCRYGKSMLVMLQGPLIYDTNVTQYAVVINEQIFENVLSVNEHND